MTKKRNLTTFMIAIMIMLFSLPVNAEGIKGYAQWDELNTTLTFYGGESVPEGAYELNTVDNKPDWNSFSRCTIVKFDESFKDVRPTSCYRWFDAFTQLTTIDGIEYLNTEEVTNMSYMFYSCQNLTELYLSSFNTAKVKNMSYMFSGCPGLSYLGLSSFNTAEVENMSCMFSGCSGLSSLDVSKFNTDKVTDMSGMFRGCESLTSLDLSSFNTAEVENMSCMFSGCSGLSSLDLSSFNTAKVTNMDNMFNACRGLTSLNLSSFNTAEVKNMSCMFYWCSRLTSLDLSSFNTAKVTNMDNMFNACSDLENLDLSSFNTAKVTNMSSMFRDCSGLTKIYVSDDFTTEHNPSGSSMFKDCSTSLQGAATYNPANTDLSMANYKTGYFTKSNLTPYVKWDASTKVLTFKVAHYIEESGVYNLNVGTNDPGWLVNNNCKKVVFTPSFNHAKPTSCYKWFSGFSNLTTIQGIENLNTEDVTNMKMMFSGCSSLTSLDLSSFNTANVTNMGFMFYDCQSLESLILSSFNTANVTTMSNMFDGCKKLTSLKLSNFNTANVTDMGSMFRDCSSLTSLELSSFNTANVTDMGFMFYKCSGLTSLDLSNFDTSNVTDMGSMFSSCSGLSSLDLSNFDTSNVKNMTRMFNGCSGLTSLDLPSFKTANVTYMSYMFNGCSRLTSLDLSNFNTSNVTNMSYMFYNCSRLTSLDLSNFNTAKVTKMDYMFKYCSGLKTIYVSDDFTTSDGTSGLDMFKGCSKLEGAASYSDLGKTGKSMANYKTGYFTKSNLTPYVKWDENTKVLTFKVANYIEGTQGEWKLNEGDTSPGWLGEVCSDCEKVVFTPSFKQAKPTSCCQWFLGFSQLTTIEGIENLNTEEVTDMSEMFNSCSGLKSLDLSKFNTANVTNMEGMFGGCDNLISLDLSSFNTAEVTDMTWMFYNCQSLTTIYVSDDFTKGNVRSSDKMFQSCFGLKGATSYYSLYTGIEMANYKDGYFKTYFTLGENKVELCGTPLTTESLDLTGDYDFTPKYDFKAKSATYIRDLSSSESTWFSLCLPFAYTPANFNFTAYKLMSATADAVEIEEITGEILAGTPVLFKFKDDVVDVDKKIEISATNAQIVKAPVEGAKVNGPDGSLQLCGTYQTKTFSSEDGNAFILLNNKLMNPARMLDTQNVKKVSVKPFRAYMTLTASAQTSSARAFSIGHGGEEGTTAIDLLNSVVTDDAEYYDINGRRIDAPAKGVNIVRRGNKTMKLIIK